MFRRIILSYVFIFILTQVNAQTSAVNHWESVVYAYDKWSYFVGVDSGPAPDWQFNEADTTGWSYGSGGFGYGDGDDNTLLPDGTLSIFIRIRFQIKDTSAIAAAILNLDYDDGCVAWLNGVEIARDGLGTVGDLPAYNLAATDHEAQVKDGKPFPTFSLSKEVLSGCLVEGLNTLAIQVNNSGPYSSDMSCIPYLSVGMTTGDTTYKPVPSWFSAPVGSGLPLVVIQTLGNTIQDGYKVTVKAGVVDHGPGKINTIADSMNVYSGPAGMEYRGSSSMSFPKKNYNFEIRMPDGSDSAVSLLGMPAESDWVLHGPYSDKALCRNFLAYNLFAQMGHYAPRTKYVNLYIDNNYQGIYLLVEKIKRDKNRVNIAKLKPEDSTGIQLTGGYIFKIDRSADGSYMDGWRSAYYGTGSEKVFFAYDYPKWDEITTPQKMYIKAEVDSFELCLHSVDFKDPVKGYRPRIDIVSFMDYFILAELSKNTDGYRLSTFLHKDRDDRDPRIHMGPVWDFNIAFGNANYYTADQTYGWNYRVAADGWGNPFWWNRFLQDPYYTNKLKCRWEELRQGILSGDHLDAMIDSSITIMGNSIAYNFDRWPVHGVWVWPNAFVGNSYEEDVDYMKNWIYSRASWLDANMPGTCNPSEERTLPAGTFSVKAYPIPAREQVSIGIHNPENEDLVMSVFDLNGKLIQQNNLPNEVLIEQKLMLPPGMYLVRVTGSRADMTVKILME